jgi:hypothetical protein
MALVDSMGWPRFRMARHWLGWAAPEIMDRTETESKKSDVYSFAMIMGEVGRRHSPWLDRLFILT